jgi:hypothetical protein
MTMIDAPSATIAPPRPQVHLGVLRLRERLQREHRQRSLLEARFREITARLGLRTAVVVVDEPLAALAGRNDPRSARHDEAAPAPPREVAPAAMPWWPLPVVADPPALSPSPGLAAYAIKDLQPSIVGVVVCGFDRAQLAAIVGGVARRQMESPSFTPIFLTDSTAFDVFREHGFVFEYLPAPGKLPAGSASRSDYGRERLDLIRRKWGIVTVVQYGEFGFHA